jgi:hypothetical protein
MKPKVKQNKEFAKWFRDWIEAIRQNRASVDLALKEAERLCKESVHQGFRAYELQEHGKDPLKRSNP